LLIEILELGAMLAAFGALWKILLQLQRDPRPKIQGFAEVAAALPPGN
jgi:hypothetical protein